MIDQSSVIGCELVFFNLKTMPDTNILAFNFDFGNPYGLGRIGIGDGLPVINITHTIFYINLVDQPRFVDILDIRDPNISTF